MVDPLGIPIDETFDGTLKGISRMDSLDRILAHDHREDAFTPAEKGVLAQQKSDHYVQLLEHLTTEDALPGAAPLLQQTQARHIPCAVASASKNAPPTLEGSGVRACFTIIADPGSLSKGKPDPEIFLATTDSIDALPQSTTGSENV